MLSPKQRSKGSLSGREVFSGWKQIADYLGMAVRTVQRYEAIGLPIHRPSGRSRGSVIAIKAELDAWTTNGHIRGDSVQKRWPTDRTNPAGAMFLQVDSEIALTFCGLALEARNEEERRRTTRAARKAYDTVTRLRENIDFPGSERAKLEANLNRLKSELEKLGEKF